MSQSTRSTGKQRTKLVQRKVFTTSSAESAFNERRGNEQCLVLTPWGGYTPVFTVPSGPYVIWQSWGQDKGVLSPGLKVGWAPWNRISHIVTKAAVTYDAPTYDVPTADNVMVNVDISITFNIVEPSDFVYKIGAQNFNEYLHGKIEEAVRGLVYGVTHNKVNDLRESFAESMMENLKRNFARFGVNMMSVKVTNVKLPEQLQAKLEKTTAFQTKIEEAQKMQETKKLLTENDALKQLEALRKENGRKLQHIMAEISRHDTEAKEMCDKQRGLNQIDLTNAQSSAEARITQARGDRDVAKAEGERAAEEVVRGASIKAEASRVKTETDADVMIKASQTKLSMASNDAEAMVALAQAEAGAAAKLAVKRSVDLEKKRLTLLQSVAGSGRRVVTGQQANAIMSQLVEGATTPVTSKV